MLEDEQALQRLKAQYALKDIIKYIGDDPYREGLVDTPKRIIKSWEELFWGYNQDPKGLLTTFDESALGEDLVLLKDIELYSTCEHHFLPFWGKAHIAYIPRSGRVLGVSKLARLLEIYSRRLQIQERICRQITAFLMTELQALGAGCIIEAQHFCMTSRGVKKQNAKMITSSLEGAFFDNHLARAELMALIKG